MRVEKDVPYSIDDIDAAWLTGALRDSDLLADAEVTDLDIRIIGEEAGFMGQVAVLTPTYSRADVEAPKSLILKIPIALKNRVMGQTMGVYEKEIRFYSDLRSKLKVRSPAYYYSALSAFDDPEVVAERLKALVKLPILVIILAAILVRFIFGLMPRRYVLLIEDVSYLKIGDQHAGCSHEEVKWGLTAMARLHGPYWDSEQAEKDLPWIQPLADSAKLVHLTNLQSAGAYRKARWDELSERQREMFDWVCQNGIKITEVLGEEPRTLLHGDFRLDNVCFDNEQGEALLLDWQIMNFGSGGLELAYFISSAMSADDSEEAVAAMIQHYHDALAEEGVEVSAEYLRWSYELGMLAMLHRIAPVLFQPQLSLGDDRGPAVMQKWVDCIYRRLEGVEFETILQRRPQPA